MTFDEVLDQVRELLHQRGQVTYRSLKLRYQLDDALLAGVADELIKAERVAADEDGEVLVWSGGEAKAESESRRTGETEEAFSGPSTVVSPQHPTPSTQHPNGGGGVLSQSH
jgi:hypothetical protein